MTLEVAKYLQENSPDTQPQFKQLIIPGMEEVMEKTNTKIQLTSCINPRTRQGLKSLANS
ncbi:MAG TPA: hypothetical protein V6D14_00500 [Coleofasciculaceae cyanobacterium]|jgi:hypothetical protein